MIIKSLLPFGHREKKRQGWSTKFPQSCRWQRMKTFKDFFEKRKSFYLFFFPWRGKGVASSSGIDDA
jgi:hypothetical protein